MLKPALVLALIAVLTACSSRDEDLDNQPFLDDNGVLMSGNEDYFAAWLIDNVKSSSTRTCIQLRVASQGWSLSEGVDDCNNPSYPP